MSGSALLPCDLLLPCDFEEDEETSELRKLIDQFDELYDECLTRQLSLEEQDDLDRLFKHLQEKEDMFWNGVSPHIVDVITEHLEVHFPSLRYQLGILPDNYSE